MRHSVGAARKVSPNWSQETMTCHSPKCFRTIWDQGNAPLVTSLPNSCYITFYECIYLRYLRPICCTIKTPTLNISAGMSWSTTDQKNTQSCIIRCKNSRLRLELLNLIIHSCSFFNKYFRNLGHQLIE